MDGGEGGATAAPGVSKVEDISHGVPKPRRGKVWGVKRTSAELPRIAKIRCEKLRVWGPSRSTRRGITMSKFAVERIREFRHLGMKPSLGRTDSVLSFSELDLLGPRKRHQSSPVLSRSVLIASIFLFKALTASVNPMIAAGTILFAAASSTDAKMRSISSICVPIP